MNYPKVLALAASMLALSVSANAQVIYTQAPDTRVAYTAKTVHLRAGPAIDYPVVAILESGLAVSVPGCMQDYSWCDVIAGEYRGWVYAGNLVYYYQGADVPVIDYGAAIGIGVITFVITNYWHDHYIDRPWYRQMPQWSHRPPRTDVHPRSQRFGPPPRSEERPMPGYRSPQLPPRTGVAPRPPHETEHPGGAQRLMPAYPPPQRPPGAGAAPRPPHAGVRPEAEQRHAPAPRTPGPPPGARVNPTRPPAEAHPREGQRQAPGSSQGSRPTP